MKLLTFLNTLFLLVLISACTSIPIEERPQKRADINQQAQETIAALLEKEPELQSAIDSSVGYFAVQVSAVSVAVIGGGAGIGVLYDKDDRTRTYMNVSRYDLGPGLGARKFEILILFETREALQDFKRGGWDSTAGAEIAAGKSGATGAGDISRTEELDFSVHFISETGAHLAASLRLIKVSTNYDLTHGGVSDVSIPNIGFSTEDKAPDDAPREWNRALPFMAQQVVDMGYDLPLPYGIGIVYADVTQDMLLDNLQVGFGGSTKTPVNAVSFANAHSDSESISIKVDAWLFPFMNVFAMFGTVDGQAPMDVVIDGTQLLDDLGVDCTPSGFPPVPPLECIVFDGKTPTLPITAKFKGNTYGLGTVLAGGWNNYFVTIPISFTYADMEGNNTEGKVWSVAPRVGRIFPTRKLGNLAVYIGGAYLDSSITITGTQIMPGPVELAVDYTIDQDNEEKWAGVVGANLDFTKRVSLALEYHGFTDSRESFIASFSTRF